MTTLQLAALGYVIFYYGFLIGVRAYLLYRKTGVNAFLNKAHTGIAGFTENLAVINTILISVIAFNFALLPNNYIYLVPIHYFETSALGTAGLLLSSIGLLIAFIAQLQMGGAWRFGLHRDVSQTLVKSGLFKLSRNPIYVGLMISYLGFFLMMPNAVSLCFLILSAVTLKMKVLLEESFLERIHREEFNTYKAQVRRWL
jgi:protein-S-isoprenylcysteine O-methyltransferase Ste14